MINKLTMILILLMGVKNSVYAEDGAVYHFSYSDSRKYQIVDTNTTANTISLLFVNDGPDICDVSIVETNCTCIEAIIDPPVLLPGESSTVDLNLLSEEISDPILTFRVLVEGKQEPVFRTVRLRRHPVIAPAASGSLEVSVLKLKEPVITWKAAAFCSPIDYLRQSDNSGMPLTIINTLYEGEWTTKMMILLQPLKFEKAVPILKETQDEPDVLVAKKNEKYSFSLMSEKHIDRSEAAVGHSVPGRIKFSNRALTVIKEEMTERFSDKNYFNADYIRLYISWRVPLPMRKSESSLEKPYELEYQIGFCLRELKAERRLDFLLPGGVKGDSVLRIYASFGPEIYDVVSMQNFVELETPKIILVHDSDEGQLD